MSFITQTDYSWFRALNGLATVKILGPILLYFAVYGIVIVFVVAAVYGLLLVNSPTERARRRHSLLLSIVSLIVARGVIVEAIRVFWHRQRPFQVLHYVNLLISKDFEASFPSGHATAMFSVAIVIYFYNRKLGTWLLIISAISSVSRIVSGVHYPSDILAGAILGSLVGWVIVKIGKKKDPQMVGRKPVSPAAVSANTSTANN